MKKLFSYKEFQIRKISEQKAEDDDLKDPVDDQYYKIIEITDDGVVAVNNDGSKEIISNKENDFTTPTKIEEV